MSIDNQSNSVFKIFVLCSIVCSSTSQDPLTFIVKGERIFKTGIREYTTVRNNGARTVICSSFLPVSAKITLLKGKVDDGNKTERNTNNISKTFSTSNDIEGNYTCRMEVNFEASEKHYLSYIYESNLMIKKINKHCTTNVGETGFEREMVTLICTGDGNRWNNTEEETLTDVSLSRSAITRYSCGKIGRNSWKEVCNLSSFRIFPNLQVNITPNSFVSDRNLEFTCTSSPPRLLYWRVFGFNGDILDLDQYKTTLSGDMNITIKQAVGKSNLQIAEAIPGGNGIHSVVCYSYETKTKAVILHLVQGSCEQNSRDGHKNEECKDGVPILFIISVALLVVAVATVILLLILLMRKNGNIAVSRNDDVTTDVVPPETTLHDNPVYGP